MEPTHFAISMTPALFVSLTAIFNKNYFCLSKLSGILIITSVLLTFSTVAYIAILISLVFIFSKIWKLKYLLIIPVFIFCAYTYIPEIRLRVTDTLNLINGSKKAVELNLSTYALASNAFVAGKSFFDNPLFGHGLGSHPVSYNDLLRSGASGGFWRNNSVILNREDAGSLFLRLLSETGLFGILLVIYFIFKYRIKNTNNKTLQIISNAIFIMFTMQLLRQGHYFYNGLFFFVWLYYFAYKTNFIKQTDDPH